MQITLYKITDANGNIDEGPGRTRWYNDPLLAVMLNPICDNYNLDTAKIWSCEWTISGEAGRRNNKTLKEIELPRVTLNQRIAFGVICALQVYQEPEFSKWAENWLSGKERDAKTPWIEKAVAPGSIRTAQEAKDKAKIAALWAASAAVGKIKKSAGEKYVEEAAAEAVKAAAEAAVENGKLIDLITLVHEALKIPQI